MRSSLPAALLSLPVALVGLSLLPGAARAQPLLAQPAVGELAREMPHEASATVASDGRYTLVLLPEQPWLEAEVSVSGGGSVDLGAADGSQPVEIQGVLDAVGPLVVSLAAVTADGQHGVTWTFTVEPELLPVQAPELAQGSERRRALWPWSRGRR